MLGPVPRRNEISFFLSFFPFFSFGGRCSFCYNLHDGEVPCAADFSCLGEEIFNGARESYGTKDNLKYENI